MVSGSNPTPMKFCPKCDNLLLPKEDKKRKILLNACRLCDYQEIADDNRVHRSEIPDSVDEATRTLQETDPTDPTLPRTREVPCPQCSNRKAVYFQVTSTDMRLGYICCKCGHRWKD